MKYRLIACFLFLILAGCQGSTLMPPTPDPSFTPSTPTPEPAPPPTAIIAPTLVPDPTATPDTRLPPEEWQVWPVVPAATSRAIEIYQQGLALGNNPHAFSKIGDCQNIRAAFMGFFDIPERYNLGSEYQYLQETIDNFAGYFNTDGQAVKGGFNAATVLSPLWANPEICQAGENSLECELRITKPSIVFISFEVWWEGRTVDEYEKYMRQIIETVISRGAVPILATKADNVEGDHSLNLATASLAFEYDLPLWNFWLAVQHLPNHGLDPERDDGFHISTDGWNVRSFTGLQALDSVWHGVRDASVVGTMTPTHFPSQTETFGLLPTTGSGPNLFEFRDGLIFGLAARYDGGYQSQGVYLFDLASQTTAQLLGPGWDFQDASPEDQTLLVNLGSSLYRTDGLSLTLISSTFFPYGNSGARYIGEDSIIFIIEEGSGTALVIARLDGSEATVLTRPGDAAPIELFPSTDGVRIAWESGTCSATRVCDRQGAWLTDLQSSQNRSLVGFSRPLIAPDGSTMAYVYNPAENKSNLAFATADGVPTRVFPLEGDILDDYAWQPGGGWLAVHLAVRSDYSGRVTDGLNYLVDARTFNTRQLPAVLLLSPRLLWSPDGAELLWLGTDWLVDKYGIRLFQVDIQTNHVEEMTESLGLSDTRYLFITNGAWLRKP